MMISSLPFSGNTYTCNYYYIIIRRLSDESGEIKFTLVSEGKLSKEFLDPKDGKQ